MGQPLVNLIRELSLCSRLGIGETGYGGRGGEWFPCCYLG